MSKFLLLFRSSADTFDTMAPEEVQRFNEKWRVWWAEGEREGWMLDASKALQTEGRVIDADLNVTDGPLITGSDVARGYVNIQADSIDAAVAHAKGCPVLQHGGRVEIRPFFQTHPGE